LQFPKGRGGSGCGQEKADSGRWGCVTSVGRPQCLSPQTARLHANRRPQPHNTSCTVRQTSALKGGVVFPRRSAMWRARHVPCATQRRRAPWLGTRRMHRCMRVRQIHASATNSMDDGEAMGSAGRTVRPSRSVSLGAGLRSAILSVASCRSFGGRITGSKSHSGNIFIPTGGRAIEANALRPAGWRGSAQGTGRPSSPPRRAVLPPPGAPRAWQKARQPVG
jgi:hypothetical protein